MRPNCCRILLLLVALVAVYTQVAAYGERDRERRGYDAEYDRGAGAKAGGLPWLLIFGLLFLVGTMILIALAIAVMAW
jgi:hypothetical protein